MIIAVRNASFCAAFFAFTLIAKADAIYDSWAKAKVGTVVKYKQLVTTAGTNINSDITDTLKEITPAAATIEMHASINLGGKMMEMPPQTIVVPVGVATPPAVPITPKSPVKAAEGKEDLIVNGKTYSCTVSSLTLDQNGTKSVSKIWTCDDIPGQLVKNESKMTGKTTLSSSMTLTGVEVK